MAAILIVAHAPLATSLLAVAQHVYPDCSRHLSALDVAAGDAVSDIEARLRSATELAPDEEFLVLTDVFGATPCNAASAVADGVRVRVVAGVNVPMLWRTLCYAASPIDELVARAVFGATQGVVLVGASHLQNQGASTGLGHDQDTHRHQQ